MMTAGIIRAAVGVAMVMYTGSYNEARAKRTRSTTQNLKCERMTRAGKEKRKHANIDRGVGVYNNCSRLMHFIFDPEPKDWLSISGTKLLPVKLFRSADLAAVSKEEGGVGRLLLLFFMLDNVRSSDSIKASRGSHG